MSIEFWIAKEKLLVPKEEAALKNHGTKVPRFTWSQYCQDMGYSRRVVNRWLRNWEELKKRAESPPLPKSL